MPTPYGAAFFAEQRDGSARSAAIIVPIVMDIVSPSSVIDIGCGVGTWLQAFQENGVSDVLGIDGPYVEPSALQIPVDAFQSADISQPLALDRRYDLAVCLEVAEHLPDDAAGTLVASLTAVAPVVLFSAAIPGQGGTSHVNEQWPSYWAARFHKHEYQCFDVVRRIIWDHPLVDVWYAQNILIFAAPDATLSIPEQSLSWPINFVHPRLFVPAAHRAYEPTPKRLAQMVPGAVSRAVARRTRHYARRRVYDGK
jgi:SAM-dependent methyltransferase